MGQGFVALEAARSARSGATLDGVARRAREVAEKTRLFATVDTFAYLAGPVARVAAFSSRLAGLTNLDESTTVMIEFASGALAYLGTSYFAPPVVTVAAYGTKANAWNEQDGARLFVQRQGEPARTEEPVDTVDTTVDELAEFARCIREGTRPETGGPEGLEMAAVLEAIVESVASGRAVALSDLR